MALSLSFINVSKFHWLDTPKLIFIISYLLNSVSLLHLQVYKKKCKCLIEVITSLCSIKHSNSFMSNVQLVLCSLDQCRSPRVHSQCCMMKPLFQQHCWQKWEGLWQSLSVASMQDILSKFHRHHSAYLALFSILFSHIEPTMPNLIVRRVHSRKAVRFASDFLSAWIFTFTSLGVMLKLEKWFVCSNIQDLKHYCDQVPYHQFNPNWF